jgi:hypothetical protein
MKFDLDFVNNLREALRDDLCGQPNQQTTTIVLTHLLRQKEYLLGTNEVDQYSLVEALNNKWPKNESDSQDKYELPISKYDVNQDALVEQKEGTLEQEEEEPRTPSQLVIEKGKDLESEDQESFGSCNKVIVNLWH